jgi:hypothetical protein
MTIWELGPCRYVRISYHIQTYPDLSVHIVKLRITSTDKYLIHLDIRMDIRAYPTGYPCSYPIVSNAISTLYPMHSPSISKLAIHAYPTGYPCAYPVYPMGYPLFIQSILQAYPTGYPNISKGISHFSNWISIWIICSQGIQAGSCIAVQICILARGPASSATSDGLPQCSERKRGVCNACSYPTAGPPALRHPAGPLCCSRHCCAAATNAAQQAAASFRCSRHGLVTLLIHE